MFSLRKFQEETADEAFNMLYVLKHSSALIQLPTGAGKTVISCELIKRLKELGWKILILIKQQTLLTQFYDTLEQFGIEASVLHSEIKRSKNGKLFKLDWNNPIQITMPTTLLNTDKGLNDLYLDKNWKPDLIIIDEAHKGTSSEFQEIRNKYGAQVLGLTASPYREKNEEGEHLYDWYGTRLISKISVQELIEMGLLVQPEYIDFESGEGDNKHMVNEWLHRVPNKQTIIFTTLTEESLAIKKAFVDAGIVAEIITSGSDVVPGQIISAQTPNQRQVIFNDFENGKIKVLISCGALCEGFDCPPAEVCILYRNISNHALYHQIIGRVLRAHHSKTSATIIDFRDNVKKFGRVEDFKWDITQDVPSISHVKKDQTIDNEEFKVRTAVYYTCHNCHHVYNIKKTQTCVHCNTQGKYRITTSKMKELQKIASKIKDAKNLGQFKRDFNDIFSSKTFRAMKINSLRNNYGIKNIFDTNTYELLKEYEYLKDLINNRVDANKELPIEEVFIK